MGAIAQKKCRGDPDIRMHVCCIDVGGWVGVWIWRIRRRDDGVELQSSCVIRLKLIED